MEPIVIVVCVLIIAILTMLTVLVVRSVREVAAQRTELARAVQAIDTLAASLVDARSTLGEVARQQAADGAVERQRFDTMGGQLAQATERVDSLRREIAQGQDKTREAVERQLAAIREDNARQLESMRATVDEKLSRTLNDRLSVSFRQVSEQLEVVSQGLGEMRQVASGVGDLKRVLANVKTRGMLGEVQLGAILSQILAPEQYECDVATVPGSSERVEFAVKVPVAVGAPVLMPVDAKFPGDAYEQVRLAADAADAAALSAARKQLERQIKLEAKDICTKYLSVPATTNFGIMFLPFEGLYAEVVSMPGLVECLQRDYRVNVAGPSTMAAILNSLQMSYQTFAFQRRADEIQKVLAAVKAEFPKYQAELVRARKQLDTARKTVDGIISTRTNVIENTLRDVTSLEDSREAEQVLGITGDVGPEPSTDEERKG